MLVLLLCSLALKSQAGLPWQWESARPGGRPADAEPCTCYLQRPAYRCWEPLQHAAATPQPAAASATNVAAAIANAVAPAISAALPSSAVHLAAALPSSAVYLAAAAGPLTAPSLALRHRPVRPVHRGLPRRRRFHF